MIVQIFLLVALFNAFILELFGNPQQGADVLDTLQCECVDT